MAQDGEMGPDDPFVFQLLEMESRGKSFLDAVESASNSPFTTTFTSLDMSEVGSGKICWIYTFSSRFFCV